MRQPPRIYYLPPGSMTVEAATLATVEQLKAGECLYTILRGKHTIESLTKASNQDVKCYLAYLNAFSQPVA
jgi:hypothetical protein